MSAQRPQLPIDAYIEVILAELDKGQNLVLVAEPGAGKTTRLPPALLEHFKNSNKEILVLEPRRVAAVAAADRIAEENHWQLGDEVGYRVRFENKTRAQTRLIFMTEALLARRLLTDNELRGVEVVVLDEFHERSVHVDLALGLLRELQELGRDFKIVVMSATLEAEKIAQFLGDAPSVRVPGKLFDLKIKHHDKPLRPLPDHSFYAVLVQKIKEAARAEGDVLVFLPGVGEISRTKERLEEWAAASAVELVILHGSLGLVEQRRALKPSSRKRVILSTNVAESSITVDGVTAVVDAGFQKIMRQDLATGFSRLELGRISLSSAKQRAGRAARQAAGVCFRLWGRGEEASMKKDDVAEILRSDLSESLLFLAASGVTNPDHFSWFEKPQPAVLQKALSELKNLGALAPGGAITSHGQQMVALPLEPRWAHFLILCARHGQLKNGCVIAALMQERDILREGAGEAYLGDGFENDIMLRLQLLETRSNDLKNHLVKTVLLSAQRFEHLLKNIPRGDDKSLDQIVLESFSTMLCRRRQRSEKALMVGRRGVRLAKESLVKNSEFFIAFQAIELSGSADTVINMAYGISKDVLFATFKNEIIDTEELYFDEDKGQMFNKREKRFRDLPLEEPRLTGASSAQSEGQLADFMASHLEYVKRHNENFAHWVERWAAFAATKPSEMVPAQEALLLKEAFQMACLGEKKLESILAKDLCYFLESAMPQDVISEFKAAAPTHFFAPTGSKFKIHYPPERVPFVEVRLQELFGIKENPRLLGGGTALQFHLLGPNYRPQQVTSDIASFWKNTYPEVRKELRMRYPKHSWPEDPLLAEPVRKGRSVKL